MIQAVIFDCFGVLTTENWLAFKQEKFGNDAEKMERATELNHMVDAGILDDESYIAEIARMCGEAPAEVEQVFRSVTANKDVLAIVASLKQNYKIGMLSNISGDWLLTLFTPEEVALFDALTFSYKIGVTKPDARAYHIAAEQLGVPCEACVFIDDVEQNVIAAKEQGMKGVLYTDASALRTALSDLTVQ